MLMSLGTVELETSKSETQSLPTQEVEDIIKDIKDDVDFMDIDFEPVVDGNRSSKGSIKLKPKFARKSLSKRDSKDNYPKRVTISAHLSLVSSAYSMLLWTSFVLMLVSFGLTFAYFCNK